MGGDMEAMGWRRVERWREREREGDVKERRKKSDAKLVAFVTLARKK
jgi:hypothetical protein